ncbi:MAG: hypothetical protein JJT78_11105 [Leptospira sp.]|nr:hypothetical protein [Leptospira sp.]
MTYSFPFDPNTILQASSQVTNLVHPDSNFNLIGHRIGDHLNYPTNVNKEKYIDRYSNTATLMDRAFLNHGLNGIELDVRLGADGVVYVVHDKIKKSLKPKSVAYLEENSLEKFINHFIEKDYFVENKIYIEIKLSPKIFHIHKQSFLPDVVSQSEKKLIDSLFLTLERVLSNYPNTREEIQKSIGFISFSLAALHYAYAVSRVNHDLFLITTTDQFMKRSLSRAMFYVPLSPDEKARIQYSEWLTGVWFDPIYIDNPVETFLSINELRRNPLKFYISTYGMKFPKLLKKFQSPRASEFPVSGMIFDLE